MSTDTSDSPWPLVKLSDVTESVKSWNPSGETEFTYVDISSIDNQRCAIVDAKRIPGSTAPSRARRPIQDGDVLFSNVRTYLRNVAQVMGLQSPAVASTGFTVLRPTVDVDSRYLYHLTRSDFFITQVTPEQTGTHYPATSDRVVRSHNIPLPNLATQQHLASLVDHVEHSRSSSVVHLTAALRAVERFRQAVLEAACSGQLTADWREKNSGSAQKLMGDLVVASLSSKHPIAKPDPTLLTNTPDGWSAVTLDLLIDHIEAGKSFNTLGRPATDDEWGVVKVSAMSWGHFLQDENKAIPPGHSINPHYEIKSGDLLISRANTVDLVGATVLVEETRPRLVLSDKSLRLVPRSGINKRWLNVILGSPMVREQLSSLATGTSDSMRNLSQPKILATTIALPSTEEQDELAHVVGRLFAMSDKLLHRVESASSAVDKSSQAVLAKAFGGQLALSAAV